jgi:cadmium resistance protein CadD (predicted permease)
MIPDIEKFLPVEIFKMATTIPHQFNIYIYRKKEEEEEEEEEEGEEENNNNNNTVKPVVTVTFV